MNNVSDFSKPFITFILSSVTISVKGILAKGHMALITPGPRFYETYYDSHDRDTPLNEFDDYEVTQQPLNPSDVTWLIPFNMLPKDVAINDISAGTIVELLVGLFVRTPMALIPPAPIDVRNLPPHQREHGRKLKEHERIKEFNDTITS